jgi:hypothetical protein
VLSVYQKTEALDRTQPLLPVDFGVAEERSHDHKRCWTICPLTTLPKCRPGWRRTLTSFNLTPVGSDWMN